jgi:hypothetical protein
VTERHGIRFEIQDLRDVQSRCPASFLRARTQNKLFSAWGASALCVGCYPWPLPSVKFTIHLEVRVRAAVKYLRVEHWVSSLGIRGTALALLAFYSHNPFRTWSAFLHSVSAVRVGHPASTKSFQSDRFAPAPPLSASNDGSYRLITQPQILPIRLEIRITGLWADGSAKNM